MQAPDGVHGMGHRRLHELVPELPRARNPTLWPGSVGGFRRATRRLDLAEYHVIPAAAG